MRTSGICCRAGGKFPLFDHHALHYFRQHRHPQQPQPRSGLRNTSTRLRNNGAYTQGQYPRSTIPQDHSRVYLDNTVQEMPRKDVDLIREFGLDLTGGVVTLDDASFTTTIGLHHGSCASRRLMALAIPDAGPPQTFITTSCWNGMLRTGATDDECLSSVSPRTFGGFGPGTTLSTT